MRMLAVQRTRWPSPVQAVALLLIAPIVTADVNVLVGESCRFLAETQRCVPRLCPDSDAAQVLLCSSSGGPPCPQGCVEKGGGSLSLCVLPSAPSAPLDTTNVATLLACDNTGPTTPECAAAAQQLLEESGCTPDCLAQLAGQDARGQECSAASSPLECEGIELPCDGVAPSAGPLAAAEAPLDVAEPPLGPPGSAPRCNDTAIAAASERSADGDTLSRGCTPADTGLQPADPSAEPTILNERDAQTGSPTASDGQDDGEIGAPLQPDGQTDTGSESGTETPDTQSAPSDTDGQPPADGQAASEAESDTQSSGAQSSTAGGATAPDFGNADAPTVDNADAAPPGSARAALVVASLVLAPVVLL